ncbi:myosin-2 heavy chain-like isoform X1 [Anguilla anguilla]|uniref:myosin-2 heavy chain-like isoform X1 n=2 Tax=Anguilla anguilla TaxID=7936 RepID=UPI0015AB30DC|nr:myosin-2 heavy chain-like isoform X1 [Anguilla anguilla]
MNPRASCRKDTGILLWTRDCKPDRTTERRMLLTSLDKTDIDMQNRHNLDFSERKRSMDKEWTYKQEVTTDSPSRDLFKSSDLKQPLDKGLTHDFAQMRKDKLVPFLPGKGVDAPRFLRSMNRRGMQNPLDEMALLNQGVLKEKLPQEQKCLEIELDEALANLHNMSTERDNLAEQLRVSQEQAKSEQMYLLQRVKDLQATIFQLDEERCDLNSKQSIKAGQILDLEKQIHTYSCKLDVTEEELKKSQTECNSQKELKTKSENALSDTQSKLKAKVRELQNVLERNEQLEQKSDSLFEQLNDVRNGLYSLQSMTFQLNKGKEALQEELDKKDKLNGSLSVKVEKLETSAKSLHEEVSRGNKELDAMQRKLTDTKEQLNAVLREKDVMFQANTDLQDDLDKVHLDNLSLQRKVEGSSQEMEVLQRKVQDFMTESSCSKMLLSSKDEVIDKLKFAVKELETSVKSLQQEVNRGNSELDAIQRKLTDKDQQLNNVTREKEALLKANSDLQSGRYRTKADKQGVESRGEGYSQEVELLQRRLQDYMTESSHMEMLLWSKEDIIEDLELTVEELETSTKNLHQEVSRGDRDLDVMKRKLTDKERQLNAVTREKEALLKANTDLQGGLYRIQRDNQEEVIEALRLKIQELESSVKSLQQALRERDCELESVRKKVADTEKELDCMEKEKEAMRQAKAALREDLSKVQLDNQALQRKMEGSSQDGLQRKLQESMTENSYLKILMSSKEDVIEHLQATVKELRAKSLQQEVSKDNSELDATQRKLRDAKENLDTVLKEKEVVLKDNADLKGVLTKVQLENQALQRMVEESNPEVELLQKKLQESMNESLSTGISLSSKDEAIARLRLTVAELEESAKSLQQAVNRGNSELEAAQKKLRDTEKSLDTLVGEKEAMFKEQVDLQGQLDKINLDNRALQRKVEGSSQEVELLRKTLQDYMTEGTHTKILLSSKEDINERMHLRIQELDTSAKNLQQAVSERDGELDAVQKKLIDAEKKLDFVVMEKKAMLQANNRVRIDFDKLRLDNEALQRKVEGSSQEVELLQRKLQDYMTEISQNNILLSSKEEAIASLRHTVTKLETKNVQQEVSRGSSDLQRKLTDTEENLVSVIREKDSVLKANADLRDTLEKIQLNNQSLQRKVEGSNQEVELLQRKLQNYTTQNSQNNILLSSKEEAIASLRHTVTKLETKNVQQEVSKGSSDLQRKLTDTEENLVSVIREKDSVLKANADLRDTLEKIQLDNQVSEKSLQSKVEGSSQEMELLQKKLQDSISKTSSMNEQLSLREEVTENLQLTVKELETSVKNLQHSANRAQKELQFARKRVSNTEEILSALMKEKETTEKENLDLRDELYSMQSGNQALQRKMEGSSQEVELLQMELQDFSTDVNILQSWVSSSEAAIARLLKTFEGLEPSVEALQHMQSTGNVDPDAARSEWKSTDAELVALTQKEEGTQETLSNC